MSQFEFNTADQPDGHAARGESPGEYTDRPQPQYQLLSLGSVVRDALPRLRAAIENTTLLRIAVDVHAPMVQGNPQVIQRVLLNLVVNASRALRQPHGVIEIGVSSVNSSDGRGPLFVRLTVADNGRGMDGATYSDLRQDLAEAAADSQGSERGLHMVQREIRAHGGRLQIDTLPGDGTTIRIDLPAVRRRPA
jgi:signal transduction histidine kinase